VNTGDHVQIVVTNDMPHHDAPARRHRSERHGRRAVHHAGPDHAGRVLHVRVRRRGPAGDVRLPLAPQLDRAGRQRVSTARSSSSRSATTGARSTASGSTSRAPCSSATATGFVLNGKEFPATQPIVRERRRRPDPSLQPRRPDPPDASARLPLRGVAQDGSSSIRHSAPWRTRSWSRPVSGSTSSCAPTTRACGRTTATSFRTSKDRRACTGW
jgi:hypothetical protein